MQKSMSLKYEPASEPLHISVRPDALGECSAPEAGTAAFATLKPRVGIVRPHALGEVALTPRPLNPCRAPEAGTTAFVSRLQFESGRPRLLAVTLPGEVRGTHRVC